MATRCRSAAHWTMIFASIWRDTMDGHLRRMRRISPVIPGAANTCQSRKPKSTHLSDPGVNSAGSFEKLLLPLAVAVDSMCNQGCMPLPLAEGLPDCIALVSFASLYSTQLNGALLCSITPKVLHDMPTCRPLYTGRNPAWIEPAGECSKVCRCVASTQEL
jgi:hypothetical protein